MTMNDTTVVLVTSIQFLKVTNNNSINITDNDMTGIVVIVNDSERMNESSNERMNESL